MRKLILFFIAWGVLAAGQIPAQEIAETLPLVGKIAVKFKDNKSVSEEVVLAHIQIKEGMPYDLNLVDRSIHSLYDTNLFDYIDVQSEEMRDGRMQVNFIVQPKYKIKDILFKGNKKYTDKDLKKKVTSKSGQMLDEQKIKKDRDAIYDYYLDKGFSNATVDYQIEKDPESGRGTVTFVIEEKNQFKINRVDFTGNTIVTARKLRKQMDTSKWHFWSFLTGSGHFNEKVFQEDLGKLRDCYKNEGYLDVEIAESGVKLEYPTPKKLIITIHIEEGRRYKMGNIFIEGNTLFKTEQLMRVLKLKPGHIFSPKKLDDDRELLRDVYGSLGYLETTVYPERIANVETGNIDVRYIIKESEKFFVETIKVEGNTKTKSIVIIRELALAPGDVFNLVFMKNSEARLKNTRFFDEVNCSPESTNIPGRRNLKVTVKEARTGQFEVGAGFSSLEKAMVFCELSQSNFDLFNWRSFFQGDGQKFRLRVSVGSVSNEIILAFEEPWLFERRLALGFEIYRSSNSYESAYYTEVRTGFDVYLRKRIIELVNARLGYKLENIELKDVSLVAPQFIIDSQGNFLSSSVSLTLSRDTRDSLLYATRGNRVQQDFTFAGLGGDAKFVKIENRSSIFIPTFEFGGQVVSFLGRAGSLIETGERKNVFFTDRFFLGGPYDLRGFHYHDVGPRDAVNFEPMGGDSYLFGSAEYTIRLAEPLRFAFFYDCGSVFYHTGFTNTNSSDVINGTFNDNWGFGIRLLVAGAPLRLDYGIPITNTKWAGGNNNSGGQFNFSFGTRF